MSDKGEYRRRKEFETDKILRIAGKFYEGMTYSLAHPPCMECHKQIKRVPVRLWNENEDHKTYEWHFCRDCAKELGLFDDVKMREIAEDKRKEFKEQLPDKK